MWPVPLHVLKGVQESQFPGEAEDRRVGSGRCLHHMCPPRDSGDLVGQKAFAGGRLNGLCVASLSPRLSHSRTHPGLCKHCFRKQNRLFFGGDNEKLFPFSCLYLMHLTFMNKAKALIYHPSLGLRRPHFSWDSHSKVVVRIEQSSPWKTSKLGTKQETCLCPLKCLVTTELFASYAEDVFQNLSHPRGSNYFDPSSLPQTPAVEEGDWGKSLQR